jgi:hypothetical protein
VQMRLDFLFAMMVSQLSQPSWVISARFIGKNGAVPKRCAQY